MKVEKVEQQTTRKLELTLGEVLDILTSVENHNATKCFPNCGVRKMIEFVEANGYEVVGD